ncbi:PIN domain-containing protein [Ramlibacter sp. WS9]|uniref:PIN domain-containing protein n=1 Tax=Ramlibacter sp. WS9 TaxID=1882741 RepID=UPI0011448433|nr:PIN domain-containing protein [Ramlibacter sp. WS9]ROZ79085.1 type II toxin-antitoxin system VapC family toxin [Ramlibacter sp. WS9]
MPKYLLDTNACIAVRDLKRGKLPNDPAGRDRLQRLQARLQAVAAADIAMSAISMGELRFGADKSGAPQKNHELLDKLGQLVTVMPLAEPVCRHYGQIRQFLEAQGQKIGPNDNWIAAHGREAGCTVVTANTGEFSRVPGLVIENWTQ